MSIDNHQDLPQVILHGGEKAETRDETSVLCSTQFWELCRNFETGLIVRFWNRFNYFNVVLRACRKQWRVVLQHCWPVLSTIRWQHYVSNAKSPRPDLITTVANAWDSTHVSPNTCSLNWRDLPLNISVIFQTWVLQRSIIWWYLVTDALLLNKY